MAVTFKRPVLYVADEEKLGFTLADKMKRLKVSSPHFYISDRLPTDYNKYAFLFLDSLTSMGVNPVQLSEMYETHPKLNLVSIFQCNNEGKFYSQNTYGHDVDTIIKVAGGMGMVDGKNRLGGKGEVGVFDSR